MPPRSAKAAPAEKDLYLILVEPDEKGVLEDHVYLTTKLVSDKIFSESPDIMSIARMDNLRNFSFEETSWNMLKQFRTSVKAPTKKTLRGSSEFRDSVLQALETTSIYATEDCFQAVKVLLMGHFSNFVFKTKDLEEIKTKVEVDNMLLTVIFPAEVHEMSNHQRVNFHAVSESLNNPDHFFIHTIQSCMGTVLNRVALKSKRSMPWKITFEIGCGIEIPVRKLIINRKQTLTMKTKAVLNKNGSVGEGVEAKTRREIAWQDNEGESIDVSEVAVAYSYGEKVVTLADEKVHETSIACLQLLVFCPRENILPAYLTGEGTDILFPQEGNENAALKFDALLQAMLTTNTVAVVRKVLRKNARIVLTVLSPDAERSGLIVGDLCFADDVSTPHFPALIKSVTNAGEMAVSIISNKDALIDQLIQDKSIDEFNPEEGPVNPLVRTTRDFIIQKILVGEGKPRIVDNVALFFNKIPEVQESMLKKIKAEFPIEVKKEPNSDRPSGSSVFRKRVKDEGSDANRDDKKIKMGTPSAEESEVKMEIDEEEPTDDIDDLLGEL